MDQALESFSASAARGTLSRAVESMPTPLLLLLFFTCVIVLQCLHAAPAGGDPLLPTSAPRLVSLPGLPAWQQEKGHVYLDLCSRQLVVSAQKLDAYERAAHRRAREEGRKLRKYYRLKTLLREYRPMGPAGAVEEELEVV